MAHPIHYVEVTLESSSLYRGNEHIGAYGGHVGEFRKFPVSRILLYGGSLHPGLTVLLK